MLKKITQISCLLTILGAYGLIHNIAFADIQNTKAVENPASIGSKQGSNQIFGDPVDKTNGKYYKNNQHVENINKTTQGSKIGSNQVFGDPKVSHNKRHMAHKHSNMQPNKPTQGSKVGSNQVFGEPAIIDAQHTR